LKPERTASPNFAGQLSLSRTDGLAAILRDRIVKGVYRPGDRIREIELQQEFKLSNGPVREALQRLVADGILDRSPWRGVRVAELGKKEIIELFQLRVALLEYAVELAARRRDPAVLAEAETVRSNLRKALSRVKKGDLALMSAELIEWILRGAGNSQMFQVWEKTLLQSRIYAYESMRRTAARTEPLQYQIIDAILAGDVAAARGAVRALTRETLIDLNIEADI
jgi:DNA-binding GntR family transcriptional regulator